MVVPPSLRCVGQSGNRACCWGRAGSCRSRRRKCFRQATLALPGTAWAAPPLLRGKSPRRNLAGRVCVEVKGVSPVVLLVSSVNSAGGLATARTGDCMSCFRASGSSACRDRPKISLSGSIMGSSGSRSQMVVPFAREVRSGTTWVVLISSVRIPLTLEGGRTGGRDGGARSRCRAGLISSDGNLLLK